MKRTVLTFGILAGAIIIAYSYIVFLVLGDFSTPQAGNQAADIRKLEMAHWLGYVRYLVLLLGVVMAMLAYRRGSTGPIRYGRIAAVGVLVALITGVFVGTMEYIYTAFINPDFYQEYSQLMIEGMRAGGATAATIKEFQQHQKEYAWMANPGATGLFYFFETGVIGTLLALIAASFMQRKEEEGVVVSA